jgi:hypothetical protein
MKHFFLLLFVLATQSHANAQIQVLNIPDGTNPANISRAWSTDYGYYLKGSTPAVSMVNAKAKLANTSNFGPSGTVPML